jgi:hypothetical protein
MPDTMTLELKRDDACLWLHVTNGQQHGLFNLGSGLRENGQDVLAVQLLRECIAHYAALSQPSTNPPEIGSKLVDGGVISDDVVERAFATLPNSGIIDLADMRTALEAVAPLLRAPAERGGRVDERGVEYKLAGWWKITEPGGVQMVKDCPVAWKGMGVPLYTKLHNQTALAQNAPGVTDEVVADACDMVMRERSECAHEGLAPRARLRREMRAALEAVWPVQVQNAQGEAVAKVRHFDYRGIARNGFSQEAEMLDGAPTLPDGTLLYAGHAERARVPDGWSAWHDDVARTWAVRSPTGDVCEVHDRAGDVHAEVLRQLAQELAAAASQPDDAP